MWINLVRVEDFIFHGSLADSVENNSRATLFHVIDTAILIRSVALARLQVLKTFVEKHSALLVGNNLDIVRDVGTNES